MCCWRTRGLCELKPSQPARLEAPRVENLSVAVLGKGQRFPSEQGDNILHCTAPSRMSGCQSVPSSQGSPASRPEGPSRGGFSVLFQCILPPSSPNTSVFDVQGLGLAVLSLWGRLLPSCSSRPCLQMNHRLLSTWVPLQAPDTVCEGCDPLQLSLLTEQVLLHTLGGFARLSFCRAQ